MVRGIAFVVGRITGRVAWVLSLLFRRRGDVSTMVHIRRSFRRWRNLNATGTIEEFASWLIGFRYSLPGYDPLQSEIQRQIALLALPIYARHLNADGSVSFMAILGALSEAERFTVEPGVVMRKAVGWKNRDLFGVVVGGAGVPDLARAFRAAEVEFQEVVAEEERRRMGL